MRLTNFPQRNELLQLHGERQKPVPVQTPRQRVAAPVENRDSADDSRVELSPDQGDAICRIENFLLGSEICFSLVGPAGTGKTFLMDEIVRLARSKTWRVYLSAPTHQAAARLRGATSHHTATTHKLLGVSLVRDKRTGQEGLKAGQPMADPRSLLVVDESSMLPQKLLNIITRFAQDHDCKILFVGDAAQLNPVKENPSQTVDQDSCEWELAELTTIHRQAAENPIIAAATAVRLADPAEIPPFKTLLNGEKGVQVMPNKREWADLMLDLCSRDDQENRYIGYTNRATDEAAKAIRRHKFGADADQPYLPGELLIVNSRCVVTGGKKSKKRGGKKKTDVIIPNNDHVMVKAVWRDGPMYLVDCDWHGRSVSLRAFANYGERDRHLSRLRATATREGRWNDYFDAVDNIADLRSATTVTAHCSQGSTFDNVFINLQNIAICRNKLELQRLLYVAITRASGTVYLTGELR